MANIGLFSELIEIFGSVVVLFGLIGSFSSIVGIALYVLNGIGLYEMAKKMNFSNPWISFIPFANVFALGRIAERYVKRDGTKSAKFSIVLLCFYIIEIISLVIFIAFLAFAVISLIAKAEIAINDGGSMALSMFNVVIPVIIFYFILLAVAVTYNIFYYVAYWRVMSIFCNENATLFTILSIFFNFLAPIFIFVNRKREPKLTYAERMNSENNFFDVET